jgi:hypothetical protein
MEEAETQISYDLGDRLIEQMKELNLLLKRKLLEKKNEKQRKNILSYKQ